MSRHDPTETNENIGKMSTPGAPKGNVNALRHGARSARILEGDAPPAGCAQIKRAAARFRAALETAVVAKRGQIGIPDAAAIHNAYRCEVRARLLGRWLRQATELDPKDADEATTGRPEATVEATTTETTTDAQGRVKTLTRKLRRGLPIETRMQILRDIASATEARDRAIARLRLDDEPATGKLSYIDALTDPNPTEPPTDDPTE